MLINLINSNYDFQTKVIHFFAFIIAVIVCMTLHEFAHAFTAYKCGDPTAKQMKRMTLNPVRHFDLTGILCFLFVGFGWAKPVPINTFNFKHVKRGTFLTSIAGVVTNILTAFVITPFLFMLLFYGSHSGFFFEFFATLFEYVIWVSVVLFVFNLLPIYPLDGFNMISAYMKYDNKFVVFMRKYGYMMLIALLVIMEIVYITTNFSLISFVSTWVRYPIERFWLLFWGI